MWSVLIEWQCYKGRGDSMFNSMGLIADGIGPGEDPTMNNVPRLAYYSYKLLTSKIDGSDWDQVSIVNEADNIYAYKYPKAGGSPVWIVWWEDEFSNAGSKQIQLSVGNIQDVVVTRAVPACVSGKQAGDLSAVVEYMEVPVTGGNITLNVIPGEGPLYIEDKLHAILTGTKVNELHAASDYNRANQLLVPDRQAKAGQ
jgi:hypothetical protein